VDPDQQDELGVQFLPLALPPLQILDTPSACALSLNRSRLMLAPRQFVASGVVLVYPADEEARGEEGDGGL
jgi:hypothetical protein